MREENYFDNIIKERVGNMPSEVPSDMWDRIEAKRADRDKVFWWQNRMGWFGIALLFVTGSVVYSLSNGITGTDETSGDANQIAKQSITLSKTSESATAINSLTSQIASKASANKTDAVNKLEIKSTNTSNNNSKNLAPAKNESAITALETKASSKNNTRKASRVAKKTTSANRLNNTKSSAVAETTSREERKARSNAAEVNASISDENTVSGIFEDVIYAEKQSTSLTSYSSTDASSSRQATANTPLLASLSALPSGLLFADNEVNLDRHSDGVLGCKSKRKRDATWYLDLMVSPDAARRSLTSKNQTDEAYLDARQETEYFSNAYSVAARVSYVAESGVALRSGLVFSQITEKLDYYNDDIQTLTIVSPIDTIVNGSNTTIVYDTTLHIQDGERHRLSWNRYKHIDIPLVVGYEFGNGPWRFNVNGGVYVNIEAWQRGQFLQPDTTALVSFETGTPDAYEAFKRNVGLSLYTSVAVSYEFGDKMQLLIEPKYRHFLKPHTLDSYELEQRYSSYGVFAGIRFRL